jgi:2-methylcitrate dehydratase PrpD
MSQGATREIAEWSSTLGYDDIPARLHAKSKLQILSVLGGIHAGRHSEGAMSGAEVARSWGGPGESTVFVGGDKLPRHNAIFANTIASVAFDFDDYLCFGHTGHSAVCGSFAYGELEGASGKDVLAAITVGNEVGGRLGGALLLGPQNGQMWSYIHVLEGACVAGRFVGLDSGRMANAIGVAFTQPPYPLMPAFMGPDSKLMIPASTTIDGCRAAELASRGWTGNQSILEDRQGFLRRFNDQNFGWMLTGLGEAWVSDSLCYKVVPGCAYIDTAVDAFTEICRRFEADNGRRPTTDDVDEIHVRCGLLTSGMEGFAQTYRSAERLEPISINFSVALSFGLILHAGALGPQFLSHKYLDANREGIEAVAAKVHMAHDAEMDKRAGEIGERGSVSVRSLLGGQTLAGQSFEGYVMTFPTEVTLRTATGAEYTELQDIPLGGAGRPWEETDALVREKFLTNFSGDRARADEAVDAVLRLEQMDDVRELTALLAG